MTPPSRATGAFPPVPPAARHVSRERNHAPPAERAAARPAGAVETAAPETARNNPDHAGLRPQTARWPGNQGRHFMHAIIYLVGLIVIVLAIVNFVL